MRRLGLCLIGAVLGLSPGANATVVDVSQKGRQFIPETLSIKVGDILRVRNDDMFLHHVYVIGPDFHFDSEEQPPGNALEIKFTHVGDFMVRCRIHPKMRLDVHVGP